MNRTINITIAIFLLMVVPKAWSIEIDRYVKVGGAGNGTSWENACGSIQKAVDDVKRGGSGTVHVAAGTYYECVEVPNSTQNITLLGGYPATGEGERSSKTKPIIDATGKRKACLLIDYFCSEIVVDGFSMKNGVCGINVMAKETTISDCTVSNCSEAGINLRGDYSDLLVENCLVYGCDGFGIKAGNQVVIKKSSFINNRFSGMYLTGCEVYDCVSANNNSHGIHMNYSKLYRCRIFNNVSVGEGGGIYVGYGGMSANIIFGSLIFNNTAKKGGGIYLCSNTVIQSCDIVNNSATKGGGITSNESEYTEFCFSMNGSVLWNNRAAGVPSQLALPAVVKITMYRSGIQGGGVLPETDAELGIIDLSAKNNDLSKPFPSFVKICPIVGASRVKAQASLIIDQDFHLSKESACIGTGGYFGDLEIEKPWHDLDGKVYDFEHLNMGCYN